MKVSYVQLHDTVLRTLYTAFHSPIHTHKQTLMAELPFSGSAECGPTSKGTGTVKLTTWYLLCTSIIAHYISDRYIAGENWTCESHGSSDELVQLSISNSGKADKSDKKWQAAFKEVTEIQSLTDAWCLFNPWATESTCYYKLHNSHSPLDYLLFTLFIALFFVSLFQTTPQF